MSIVIPLLMLGVAIAGAALSAYMTYEGARQQQQAMKDNAKMREEDARMQRLAGEAAAARQRKKDAARMASFKSRAAAHGVIAGEGSSLLAELDFATDAETEAQHLKYGYELSARSKDIQAGFMRSQADQINPEMQAGASLLSSAGSIATSYYGGMGAQKGGGLNTRATSPSPSGPATSPKYYDQDA